MKRSHAELGLGKEMVTLLGALLEQKERDSVSEILLGNQEYKRATDLWEESSNILTDRLPEYERHVFNSLDSSVAAIERIVHKAAYRAGFIDALRLLNSPLWFTLKDHGFLDTTGISDWPLTELPAPPEASVSGVGITMNTVVQVNAAVNA